MGIQSFSKVFPAKKEITYKDLKGKNIVIDASVEIYRAALGMALAKGLTDSSGMPTIHLNSILLGVILKLKSFDINQYWVFDHKQNKGEEFHIQLKELELKKRSERRRKAKEQIEALKALQASSSKKKSDDVDELFSDDDETDLKIINELDLNEKIEKQEKVAFSPENFYREDIIFMLDMLDIKWIECPATYEAEQIAAISTFNKNIFGVKMDYVLTTDFDVLLFNATSVIRRDTRKKKLYEYNLKELLEEYELSQNDLIKIGLILGTDFAPKTPKIGPKTVLKKYKNIVLTPEQIKAEEHFKKSISDVEIKSMIVKNIDKTSFTDNEKYKEMLDWLELVKSFNRERISKQFKKNKLFVDVD